MNLDQAMLESVGRHDWEQLWRIYSWHPPAISVGKNQVMDDILKLDSLSQAGVTVVKRPTGGRAIYHKNDICISAAGLLDKQLSDGSPAAQIYLWFAGALAVFFENLAIEVSLARGTRLAGESRSGIGKLPCFLSATPYELMAAGKKIAGIALYVARDRFLVQSSLRLAAYDPGDFAFFKGLVDSPGIPGKVTSIGELRGRHADEEELRQALRRTLATFNKLDLKVLEEGDLRPA